MQVSNPAAVLPGPQDVVWVQLTRRTYLQTTLGDGNVAKYSGEVTIDDGIGVYRNSHGERLEHQDCVPSFGSCIEQEVKTTCIEITNHATVGEDLWVTYTGTGANEKGVVAVCDKS